MGESREGSERLGRSGGLSREAVLTHRQRQALETRRLIAEAAGRLFLERGYAATTMDAIGGEAGVAVSTVYAAFKNKRAILKEIRLAWHDRTRERDQRGGRGAARPGEASGDGREGQPPTVGVGGRPDRHLPGRSGGRPGGGRRRSEER